MLKTGSDADLEFQKAFNYVGNHWHPHQQS